MSDFICLSCPNGCHLAIDALPDGAMRVQGNKCDKGLAFAQLALKKKNGSVTLVTSPPKHSHDLVLLEGIVGSWGVVLKRTRSQLMPVGSPERTLFRMVVEDDKSALYVLEQIPPATFHAKMKIIKTLEFLSGRGLSRVAPYLMGKDGQYIQKHEGGFWQMVPFLPGDVLDRRTYLYEGWRAKALSVFLVELKEKSDGIPFFTLDKRFSIKKYIYTLVAQIKLRHGAAMPSLNQVLSFLEAGFMPAHDALPVGFCHGDYHPMNIVWGKDDIRAVIDWEFAGFKPEMYDVANLVGCLGIEHPSSLRKDLVVGLMRQLKDAGIFTGASWSHFLELVVALRFAWLSEWFRKQDEEMVAMELEYMALLIDNKEELKYQWGVNKD